MKVSGWGRHPVVQADVRPARSVTEIAAAVAAGPVIARGLGRSYGDSSLAPLMVDLTSFDALLGFDDLTGVLTCEAGVSLSTIVAVLLPRGWFLPVTPGTRFITVGGAVASDVHGKNHHSAGSFARYVDALTIMLADGTVVTASRDERADLFHATCGGMGLTGIILTVSVRLMAVRSDRIDEHLIKTAGLADTLAVFEEHRAATYSVAWIDLVATGSSLGRSLVMLGEHATDGHVGDGPGEHVTPFPVDLPSGLLNRHTVRAFNTAYYGRVRQSQIRHVVSFDAFFYPLDKIADWNRVYGPRGFLQYQFVIPFQGGPDLLHAMVDLIAASGLASPLAVLKTMGEAGESLLGFASPGFTLAIDLQVSREAFDLCDRLDALVVEAEGRIYLTKDSRMSPETFRAGYPRLAEFEAVRDEYGATGTFASAQSRRLGLA